MIVVSDTSPLTYLHQIGRLGLLRELYGEVVIPTTVQRELQEAVELHAGMDWSIFRVLAPKDLNQVAEFEVDLDRGESEAIVLALELGADLLLIDEATGRDRAARLGLRRTGLLGVLLEAKVKGRILSVKEELKVLLGKTNFRIQELVKVEFLRLAGEGD